MRCRLRDGRAAEKVMITAEQNRIYIKTGRGPGAYIGCFTEGGRTCLRIVVAESTCGTFNVLTVSGNELRSLHPFHLLPILSLHSDSVFSLSSASPLEELREYTQSHAPLFPAPYTGDYPLLPVLGSYYHPYFELLCKAGLGLLADHLLSQLTDAPDTAPASVYPPLAAASNPREIYGLPVKCLRKAQKWSHLPEFTAFLQGLRMLFCISPALTDLEQYSRSWALMVAGHLSVCHDPVADQQRITLSFLGDVSQKQLLRISGYLARLDETEPEKEHLSSYMDYCRLCTDLQLWPEGLTPKDPEKAKKKAADMHTSQTAAAAGDDFTLRICEPSYNALSTEKDEADPESPLYDQKYTVRIPLSPAEMSAEAAQMRSCLASYIRNVQSGAARILFLRRRCSPQRSFVTLEVSPDGKLLQAKSFANGRLTPSARKYLTVWAREKGIEICTADIR